MSSHSQEFWVATRYPTSNFVGNHLWVKPLQTLVRSEGHEPSNLFSEGISEKWDLENVDGSDFLSA
jgi:hypothetical protein